MGRVRNLIAAGVLVVAQAFARAGEHSGDPLNRSLREYGAILGMTVIGGFAGWYQKVRRGEVSGASLFGLIGEMATSALAGLGAFFISDYLGAPTGITAAIAGLAGYMGGRAIEQAERALQARIDRLRGRA